MAVPDFNQDHYPNPNPSSGHTRLLLQNRWEVIKQLGQGGMGTVYLAHDLRLSNRLSVVKKLQIDFFREDDREQALSFFQREAMVLSSLKHPNIVLIHDYFEELGNYYLVMEYVEGQNFREMLLEHGEPFSEDEVRDWCLRICDVLHYLHNHHPPVIYRDLKPSNIMVDTNGDIKLVDFGIARPYLEESDNTHVVSAGYSPPEQYWGGADQRSDIYALGATMHFLLTGKEPLALTVSSPKKIYNLVSNHMDEIVQKATAQDVWLRYQSALEMRDDLIKSLSPEPSKLPKQAIFLAAILLGSAALGLTLMFLGQSNHSIIPQSIFHIGSAPTPKAENVARRARLLSGKMQAAHDLKDQRPHILYAHDLALSETDEEALTDPQGKASFSKEK